MTDRELLELAAKAAGYGEIKIDDFGWVYRCAYQGEPKEWEMWNPLTDDGDALRLAVKLHLVVASMRGNHECDAFTACYHFNGPEHMSETHNGDPYAATRRAITRVAAEIGKTL